MKKIVYTLLLLSFAFTKMIYKEIKLDSFPMWNYDGCSNRINSNININSNSGSDVLLKPQVFYRDPFRKPDNSRLTYLVLCDKYIDKNTPHPSNTRFNATKIFNNKKELEPVFGIEQEFFISRGKKPIGFIPNDIILQPQRDYYCGTGGDNIIGRRYIEEAFNNCLYAGLHLTGLNADVAPSQWEFQICTKGIKAADEIIMLRYIVDRTLEIYSLNMDLNPKPINDEWNESRCHTNFSTKPMREKNGYNVIIEAIKKLEENHINHMENYGANKNDIFSSGVGERSCSIRIPPATFENKCGYLEDRRPLSNIDPYIVTALIYKTTSL